MNDFGPLWLGVIAALIAGVAVAGVILPSRLRRYSKDRQTGVRFPAAQSGLPPSDGKSHVARSLLTICLLLVAFVVGFIFVNLSAAPRNDLWAGWRELFRRWHWARQGGTGESADWGEPFFYLCLLGVPTGLLFSLVTLFGLKLFEKFFRSVKK